MSLWGNWSSLEAVEVKGMGSFRGRALSICNPLDLRTVAHITLAIQPLPTRALLGFGFHTPWQSALSEDLGSLTTLGCTGLCEAACSQAQTVVLSRLCLGTGHARRGALR